MHVAAVATVLVSTPARPPRSFRTGWSLTTMADWQMAKNARVKLRASGECGLGQMCCELPYGRRNWTGAQRCIGHRGTQDALGQCMHWARCPDGELACSVSRCACCAASTVQLRTATENRHKCSFMMSGGVVGVSTGLCAEAPGRTFDSSAPARWPDGATEAGRLRAVSPCLPRERLCVRPSWPARTT